MTIAQFLVDYSGYHHGLEGWLVLILAGWVLLFFGIGCLGKPQGPVIASTLPKQDDKTTASAVRQR